jgi:osmotically-inducible protein OsmY
MRTTGATRELEMPDNGVLQITVMEVLRTVPEIDAARIGVTAHDGVVTLSGIVSTMAEKHAVERATRHVRGVLAIAQEIAVHPPESHKQSDEEIAERALKILHWDVHVPHDQIRLKVEKGSVTLSGTVAHSFQKRAAVRDVRQLSGVTDILDDIGVIPIARAAADHAVVREKIESALRREAERTASRITITVEEGRVLLRGKVMTWRDREVAETAAWATVGVKVVDDQLTIGE